MHRAWLFALPVLALAACARPAPPGTVRPTAALPSAAVPSASATVDSAACADGVRIVADRGDAAAGYREMGLHLTNCGDRPYNVDGRPQIVVLGKDKETLDVAVAPSVHYTAAPHPVTLAPGQSALAVVSWRNTFTDVNGEPTSGVYLSIAPIPGAPRQLVKPPSPLDLGNTGRLEVSVWQP